MIKIQRIQRNTAYLIKSIELYDDFITLCKRQGIKWASGDELDRLCYWYIFEEQTCLYCRQTLSGTLIMTYRNKKYFENKGTRIVEFEKLEGKDDSKRKNKKVGRPRKNHLRG